MYIEVENSYKRRERIRRKKEMERILCNMTEREDSDLMRHERILVSVSEDLRVF